MIKPTIGRIVLYHPRPQDRVNKLILVDNVATPAAPHQHVTHPAVITFVHNDDHINITAFDSYGTPYGVRDVELAQGDTKPLDIGGWAEWPPAVALTTAVRPAKPEEVTVKDVPVLHADPSIANFPPSLKPTPQFGIAEPYTKANPFDLSYKDLKND